MLDMRKAVAPTTLQLAVLSLSTVALVIILGLYCFLVALPANRAQTCNTTKGGSSQASVLADNKIEESGQPERFIVKRLNIDLEIKPGVFDKSSSKWTLSNGVVYYATITSPPNNLHGNTFLYGHNNKSSLADLAKLITGDIATIRTTNGREFNYRYSGDEIVAPDVVNVLYENPAPPRMTVMTCQGVFSQTRRLMRFDFVE